MTQCNSNKTLQNEINFKENDKDRISLFGEHPETIKNNVGLHVNKFYNESSTKEQVDAKKKRKESSKQQYPFKRNWRVVRKSDDDNNNYWSWLHLFTILCFCGLAMSTLTLIPRHNSILDPSYWFEINISASTAYFMITTMIALDFRILFERSSFVTIYFFMKNFTATFLTWIIYFCISYIIWTIVLEYNHPMPMVNQYGFFLTKAASISSLLLMLPTAFVHEEESKKKLKVFVLYQLSWQILIILKFLLIESFDKLGNTDAQCVMALLVLMAKRFTTFVIAKIMYRIVGKDDERANFSLGLQINFHFRLFVATYLLGARTATVVSTVVSDILLQTIMTCQIVKWHKKVTVDQNEIHKNKKRNAILKLVLAELCEGLAPLAYAISFSMAYYGPNAELLGNVKSDYWQYEAVQDVSWTFLVMLGLFSMDIVCLTFNSSILWIFCRVNLFVEFCSLMQKYWYILAVKLVYDVYIHFFIHDINFGYDLTGQYGWIKEAKNVSAPSNSTEV